MVPRCPRASGWNRLPRHLALLLASAAVPALPAQTTVFNVTNNTQAALESAILAANTLTFLTSPASPVVIELSSSLIGQSIALSRALPILVVDYVTVRVAGAAPGSRVTIDATNAATAFRIASHHAVLQNLHFKNGWVPNSEADVFSAFGTDDLTLSNCNFQYTTGNSLWLVGATQTTVQDCNFMNNGGGIVTTGGTDGLDVVRCTFTDNDCAMLLATGSRVQVHDSIFDRNNYAFRTQPVCTDVTFGPGNVVRNTTGIGALVASGAFRLNILASQFTDNQHMAIQLADLCVTASISGCTLLRNGTAAGHNQMTITDSVDVQVDALQCSGGGAGVYAGQSRQLRITGSAAAPTTIGGNSREALVFDGCSDVTVDQVAVSGNLTAAGGAQVSSLGSSRVDFTNTAITASPGPGRIGMRLDQSDHVRVGLGSSVLDHEGQGVLVSRCSDVTLGNWLPGTGSLTVRGALPMQIMTSDRVQLCGTAAAPFTMQAGTAPGSFAVSITGSSAGTCGPYVAIDGRQTANIALQIANTANWLVDATVITGHTGWGVAASGSSGLQIRNCSVDGAQQAAHEGILLNPGCDGARLLGNLVVHQLGGGFRVVDSNDVLIGPGNRAIDNASDGFTVTDNGTGALTRRVTIQSSATVGRGQATQTGFRCLHVRAALTNLTATRHGIGIALQVGANATLVNTICWGNNVDCARDAASTGTALHGLRGTIAGSGGPGTWSEQNMILGIDPRFVSAITGDVRLQPGSPAIDSGLHATPLGSALPCTDAALLPRIRGGTIDRGAYEYGAPSGNTLDLAGPWLRLPSQNVLGFTVARTPAQAGQLFLLLCSGSGTGPGFVAPGGGVAPLVPDSYTALLQSVPALCLGMLDGSGRGTTTLPLPAAVLPYLPELTFAAVFSSGGPSTNPVVVRFLP